MRDALSPVVLTLTLALASLAQAADKVDYSHEVKPLFEARCFACHAALKQESGLRLDTAPSILRGGDSGQVVVPGNADESLLVQKISATDEAERMPPEGKPLSAQEIALVRQWIDQGATAPANDKPEEDPRAHWAFQKIVAPSIPPVAHPAWARSGVDAFIAAEHDARRLQPVAEAPKHVLLRRVYLDLVGLPPTRAELQAFLADSAPDAYEKVVDRLLASPQHGERWARHWMDVWRYSDWYGRRSQNDVRNSYPQIWRWRDWIIRSLNADKGYDRMVTEMLAADEVVPEDDDSVVATGYLVRNWFSMNYNVWMKDLVEHTGKAFLGLTLNCAMCHDHKYDPISQEEYFKFRAFFEPLELRQDRVAGLADPGPFQKYVYPLSKDPISAGLVRVFDERPDAKTFMFRMGDERNRMADKPPVPPAAPAFLGGDKLAIATVSLPPLAYYPGLKRAIQNEEPRKWDAAIAAAEKQVSGGMATLAAAEQKFDVLLAAESGPAAKIGGALAAAAPATATTIVAAEPVPAAGVSPPKKPAPPKISSRLRKARFAVDDAQLDLRIFEARLSSAKAQRASIDARIAADRARYGNQPASAEALIHAAARADRPAMLRSAEEKVAVAQKEVALAQRIFDADNSQFGPLDRAKEVMAKAQAELVAAQAVARHPGAHEYTPLSPKYPSASSGRRKALAAWITGRENPLTARVAANYIWMHHFGQPLVESTSNFGRNGKRPSNPKLLDYLAAELIDHGWSMKRLHRLLVTSSAYRMQSKSRAGGDSNQAIDPDNRFLWHFAARRMEAEVIRDSILHLAGTLDPVLGGPEIDYQKQPAMPRRSLYFSHHAEARMKMLVLFDVANACDCYRRTETIVPQQALALVNSRLVLEQSRLMARALAAAPPAADSKDFGRQQFVAAAFEQVLSRPPSEKEQSVAIAFLDRQSAIVRTQPAASPAAARTNNKQGGQQMMPAAAASTTTNAEVPTIGPSGDAEMRARESLVRALLNHNDFVTIR